MIPNELLLVKKYKLLGILGINLFICRNDKKM